jgi:hypothetical protein
MVKTPADLKGLYSVPIPSLSLRSVTTAHELVRNFEVLVLCGRFGSYWIVDQSDIAHPEEIGAS